jgi:hypothetical protein
MTRVLNAARLGVCKIFEDCPQLSRFDTYAIHVWHNPVKPPSPHIHSYLQTAFDALLLAALLLLQTFQDYPQLFMFGMLTAETGAMVSVTA